MKKTVRRFDLSEIGKAERTPQGFLRVPVYATRAGVFNYKTPDGKLIREFRSPEEVFKAVSLATLSGAPVTLRHPPSMINPENVGKFGKGYLLDEVKQDENKVAAIAIVSHKDAIDAVESGMHQVSCGYTADVVAEPGEWNGEQYDVAQKNIKYNHLAIVDRGRAGPEVRLRLDDDAQQITDEEILKMVKVMVNGQEFEVEEKLAEALAAHMKSMQDGSAEKMKAAESAQAEAMKQKDEAVAKADQLEKDLKSRTDSTSDENIRARVKERLSIEKVAATLGVEKYDELSDMDLKKQSILKDSPKADLTDKSEHYISARFDCVAEKTREHKDFGKQIGAAIASGTRADSQDEASPDSARQKMMDRDNAAWKQAEGGK